MNLDELFERPGLEPRVRLLIAAKAAIGPADWSRLGECIGLAKAGTCPRADLEETLLQGTLFFGFPRIVSAFGVLAEAWPADPPQGGALPRPEQRKAGEALFDEIYGDNRDQVKAMLRSYHGEFCDFVLESAYGRILARPALEPRIRELLAIAALAVLGQTPQLVAHGRAALHFGATAGELRETLVTATLDEAQADQLSRRVRRLS